ncbi:MAG: cytochrome C [Leptothrix sp. (in: Bacteria)]|nr:cytochrome C [Leptothrix sp. (in: b-proteobacteria)]
MRKTVTTLGLMALGLGLSAPALADPVADMAKAGCTACHLKDKKLVGPSYKEIAAKNKGKADAVATLTAKARAGGSGVYGPIPMPPNPMAKIGDAELKAAVEWILKQ